MSGPHSITKKELLVLLSHYQAGVCPKELAKAYKVSPEFIAMWRKRYKISAWTATERKALEPSAGIPNITEIKDRDLAIEKDLFMETIKKALDKREYAVLWLRTTENMTYDQIAQALLDSGVDSNCNCVWTKKPLCGESIRRIGIIALEKAKKAINRLENGKRLKTLSGRRAEAIETYVLRHKIKTAVPWQKFCHGFYNWYLEQPHLHAIGFPKLNKHFPRRVVQDGINILAGQGKATMDNNGDYRFVLKKMRDWFKLLYGEKNEKDS